MNFILTLSVVSQLAGCRSSESTKISALGFSESAKAAFALYDDGQFKKAIPLLEREIKEAEAQGVSKEALSKYQLKVADCYYSIQEYEKALDAVEQAIKNSGLTGKLELSDYLKLKSRVLYKMKRFKEAEKTAQRLLKIQESRLGADSFELIETLNLIIAASCAEDRCADTEPLILRQLALREKHLGNEHEHVAASLGMLAELKEKKGELKEAEKLYRKALQIRRKSSPHLVESSEKNILRIELKRLKMQQ